MPVLLDKQDSSMTLIRGEQAIKNYIDQQCRPALPQIGMQTSEQISSNYPLPLPVDEDGCAIEEACEDPEGQSSQYLP
ncbi:MAG: hypothetical protein ACR2PB_15550 [Desulfocapsaceae bacterium]